MKVHRSFVVIVLSIISSTAFSVDVDLAALRTQAKLLVESRHCYNCHSPIGSHPLPKAMKIYNLSKDDWFSTMSDRQLKEFQRRILTSLSPDELKEIGSSPKEKPLTKNQENIISRWIDSELAHRHPSSLKQILSQ